MIRGLDAGRAAHVPRYHREGAENSTSFVTCVVAGHATHFPRRVRDPAERGTWLANNGDGPRLDGLAIRLETIDRRLRLPSAIGNGARLLDRRSAVLQARDVASRPAPRVPDEGPPIADRAAQLWSSHYDLVRVYSRQRKWKRHGAWAGLTSADVEAVADAALLEAAQLYDEAKCDKFAPWACMLIKQRLQAATRHKRDIDTVDPDLLRDIVAESRSANMTPDGHDRHLWLQMARPVVMGLHPAHQAVLATLGIDFWKEMTEDDLRALDLPAKAKDIVPPMPAAFVRLHDSAGDTTYRAAVRSVAMAFGVHAKKFNLYRVSLLRNLELIIGRACTNHRRQNFARGTSEVYESHYPDWVLIIHS